MNTDCCGGNLLAAVAGTIKIDVSESNQVTILIDNCARAEGQSIPLNSRLNLRHKQAKPQTEMTVNWFRLL